jgi:RNA polymerase sigma-70 factor (ECF subfamily)
MGAMSRSGSEALATAGKTVRTEPTVTFAEIYESHFDFVWRSVRRLGVREAATEDVVQEIFLVAHRKLGEFEHRSSVKTWLFSVARNVVRRHARAQGRRRAALGRDPGGHDPDGVTSPKSGDDQVARAEATRIVDALLDTLDADKREIIVLAELEQMTMPEIAEALGINLNTAYTRLRAARHDFELAAARMKAKDEWRTE